MSLRGEEAEEEWLIVEVVAALALVALLSPPKIVFAILGNLPESFDLSSFSMVVRRWIRWLAVGERCEQRGGPARSRYSDPARRERSLKMTTFP